MKSPKPVTPATNIAKPYEPTPAERAAVEAYFDIRRKMAPTPSFKMREEGGAVRVTADHANDAIGQILAMRAIGTSRANFFDGLLSQLVNLTSQGRKPDERNLNFALSMIEGIGPTDETEAMLAAQMAAIHLTTMTFARRLAHVETLAQQDSAERALNKLARTFAVQLEAFKRYRTGGEQKVIVKHVTVNEGGQAIVGTVSSGAGGGGVMRKPDPTP